MIFSDWPWRHWRDVRGETTALRLHSEALSWRDLCARIDALASGFRAQGVGPGEGVMLRGKNHPHTLLAWLALLQCGVRVLPVNPQLPSSLLDELLPSLTLQFAVNLADDAQHAGLKALELCEATGVYDAGWQPERLASMTLTSGSTGLPKAAVHTCAAHLASAQGVLSLIPFMSEDDWLLSLPLFHVSGQGILWRWLLAGAKLTVSDKPLAAALQGCTHASLVPTQLWRLLNEGESISLKAVLLGGASIPVDLTNHARERGISSWCGYGLTEFASTVCAKAADGEPDVGFALPGREVRIVDGEVWLRATSLACGYWRNGMLHPLVNDSGWFATRDRGVLAGDCLTILGRLDNLFFSGGEGIQPEEVERVIAGHPDVRQVFVAPIDDREFGQRPVAIVEGHDVLNISELEAWARQKLARFQQPVAWLALPEHLSQGGIKISRRALQEWVATQAGR